MTSRPDLTSSSNPSHVRPGSRDWWASLLREGFGLSFWLFAAFAIGMGLTCYVVLGPEMFDGAMSGSLELVGNTLPRVAAAQFVAGFVWAMLPRDRLSRLADSNHGLRGLVVATAAGIITPGGPTSAFSLLAIAAGAGADRGILITYITSWALLAVQRIIVWDLPFMGVEFSAVRFLVCLPLPILAGMIARRLPLSLVLVKTPPQPGAGK